VATAEPAEPLPGTGPTDVRLRNQSDVAARTGPVSRATAMAGSATTTSRRWLAGWTSVNGRVGRTSVNGRVGRTSANGRAVMAKPPAAPRPGRPGWAATFHDRPPYRLASRSVIVSGSQTRALSPCGDRGRSRTRTPCRSARWATAYRPICRETETSMTGGLSSRQLISASRVSGMPTPLSLTSISTPPLVGSWVATCTGVSLAE
jgi:hypothetical protein